MSKQLTEQVDYGDYEVRVFPSDCETYALAREARRPRARILYNGLRGVWEAYLFGVAGALSRAGAAKETTSKHEAVEWAVKKVEEALEKLQG